MNICLADMYNYSLYVTLEMQPEGMNSCSMRREELMKTNRDLDCAWLLKLNHSSLVTYLKA